MNPMISFGNWSRSKTDQTLKECSNMENIRKDFGIVHDALKHPSGSKTDQTLKECSDMENIRKDFGIVHAALKHLSGTQEEIAKSTKSWNAFVWVFYSSPLDDNGFEATAKRLKMDPDAFRNFLLEKPVIKSLQMMGCLH